MKNRKRALRGPLTSLTVAALLGALGLASARRASGETTPNDGAPKNMIAFVMGGECPAGWVHVYDVEGRVVVGAIYPEDVGLYVAEPLKDREERTHDHAFSGEVTLVAKNVAAADGSNQNGAAAGAYGISGKTEASTSGLPFVQVEGCIKP